VAYNHGVYVNTKDRQQKGSTFKGDAVIAVIATKKIKEKEIFEVDYSTYQEDLKGNDGLLNGLKLLYAQAQPKVFILEKAKDAKDVESTYGVRPTILVLDALAEMGTNEFMGDAKTETNVFDFASLNTLAKDLKIDVVLSVKDDPGDFSLNQPNIIACYPSVKVGDSDVPLAYAVAGMMSFYDFWLSPSNHRIEGVNALSKTIRWEDCGDCDANKLNEKGYITAIRAGGEFRLWGNRYSLDYRFDEQKSKAMSFIPVRRVANFISQAITKAIFQAVDKNLTRNFLDNVESIVNGVLYSLQGKGAITYGKCTQNKEKNTPDRLSLGEVHFDVHFTPAYPVESIDFTVTVTDEGLKGLVK